MQQLAQRATTLTPSLTLAIDAKAKKLKAEGIDVCGFGAGEPDFDTPQYIKDAAAQALAAGFTKYTPSSGIPELRAAIAEKLKSENGIDYKASQVIVNCGAKHSCFNVILATCQAGDQAHYPQFAGQSDGLRLHARGTPGARGSGVGRGHPHAVRRDLRKDHLR